MSRLPLDEFPRTATAGLLHNGIKYILGFHQDSNMILLCFCKESGDKALGASRGVLVVVLVVPVVLAVLVWTAREARLVRKGLLGITKNY